MHERHNNIGACLTPLDYCAAWPCSRPQIIVKCTAMFSVKLLSSQIATWNSNTHTKDNHHTKGGKGGKGYHNDYNDYNNHRSGKSNNYDNYDNTKGGKASNQ